jgi:hypothetical protein
MNPNDAVRRQILQYFYERNASATSQYGKNGSAVKISDAKRDLKARYNLTQPQVMSNLTYLIDRKWINKTEKEKTVRVKGGTVPSTVTWYEISALGIEKIEGESEFKPKERYPGINVTAMGSNVITLGDGNVVNARFSSLHKELNSLKEEVANNQTLDESQKLELSVDIESMRDQLAKDSPNKTVIGHLWSAVEKVVVAAGLVEAIARVEPLIRPLLP